VVSYVSADPSGRAVLVWVFGTSLDETVGSIHTGSMDVSF